MTPDERWRSGPGLLESAWLHRWMVLAITIGIAVGGYVLSAMQDPTYVSSARLFLVDPRSQTVLQAQSRLNDPERTIPQQTERVRSRTVLSDAAARLGDTSAARLRGHIRVIGEPDVNLITIEGSDSTGEGAADIANSVAEAYIQFAEEQTTAQAAAAVAELQSAANTLRTEIQTLRAEVEANPDDPVAASSLDVKLAQLSATDTRINQVTVDATVFGSGVELFEPAEPRSDPVAPQPVQSAILAGLLGAVLAGAVAYWRAGRSDDVRSREEAADILGAPLLGEIPMFQDPVDTAAIVSDPVIDEAYALAVASIEYELESIGGRSVLITSAATAEGKTTSSLRLGLAAAQGGRQVVLVDADLRARGLTERLGAQKLRGLTDLAHDQARVDEAVHHYRVSRDTALPVIAAGTPMGESSRFLRSRAFVEAIAELRDRWDLIFLDSAPLLAVADTSILAGSVDGIVVIVRETTSATQLRQLRERLNFTAARLLGYVYVTSRPQSNTAYAYAYGHAVSQEPATRIVDAGSDTSADGNGRPEPRTSFTSGGRTS